MDGAYWSEIYRVGILTPRLFSGLTLWRYVALSASRGFSWLVHREEKFLDINRERRGIHPLNIPYHPPKTTILRLKFRRSTGTTTSHATVTETIFRKPYVGLPFFRAGVRQIHSSGRGLIYLIDTVIHPHVLRIVRSHVHNSSRMHP